MERSIKFIRELVKEEYRQACGAHWLEDTFRDARFALRTLRKARVFAVTVVVALALCIGFNAAIFAVVDAVLFRPLPFPQQDRLVSITEGVPALGYPVLPFSCPDYSFVAAKSRSFSATAAYRNEEYEMSGAGLPQRVQGARVTPSLFSALGVSTAMGRPFTKDDEENRVRVVVLSYGFARASFGTPDQALRRTILLNRVLYEVVGIMPRSFSFPIRGSRFNDRPAELFVPMYWDDQDRMQMASQFDYSMIARLQPDVSVEKAGAEVRALLKDLVDNYPIQIKEAMKRWPNFSLDSQVVPFRREFTGDVRRPLMLLLCAVIVVLLIGCADVANLVFARMAGRQREFALRRSLGAGSQRLARQVLTEGLVLSAIGGAVGLLLAYCTLPVLLRMAPQSLPQPNEVGLNWRVTIFLVTIIVLIPIIFSLGPLVETIRSNMATDLRGQGRLAMQSKRQRRLMSSAIVVQFCLACLLLTTAGLLRHSFLRASEVSPGFQADQLLSMRIDLPGDVYNDRVRTTSLFDNLIARLSSVPTVRRAGAISELPTGSTANVSLSIERGVANGERVDTFFCLGDVLNTLGVRLLRGRLLQPDDYLGSPHSAVISESLARRAWRNAEDAIGRRVKFGVDDPVNDQPWLTVVGVVADVKARLNSDAPHLAIFTVPSDPTPTMQVVVRTSSDPLLVAGTVRNEVRQLDPNLAAGQVKTVADILSESLAPVRFQSLLMSLFAIAAMLLATLGIAGLQAYNSAQRIQEFGLRIALGATRGNLVGIILKDCLRVCGAGIGIGVAASVATTRALSSLLYDTSPLDPTTFIGVPSILLLVAIAAAAFPAWRAIHADPMTTLRAE